MLEKRRDYVQIIAEILELCRKPTAKTQITHKTNTSYLGVQKFIERLQKLGLLRLGIDNKKYVTTEKGQKFIIKYAGLQELLKL